MSKIPITEQCITDCSMLNQTTCLPASPKPATIINYHLVSFPWSWILMNCELFIFLLLDYFSFYILNLNPDIPEMIWKGFVIFEHFSELKKLFAHQICRHTWDDLKGVCKLTFVVFSLKTFFTWILLAFQLFQGAMMQSKHKSASYKFRQKCLVVNISNIYHSTYTFSDSKTSWTWKHKNDHYHHQDYEGLWEEDGCYNTSLYQKTEYYHTYQQVSHNPSHFGSMDVVVGTGV